uniref:ING domain-containing protein n=1 Tax=Rodentolepis nana TaxID=102285 RepID=A0A0R3TER4_RODNA
LTEQDIRELRAPLLRVLIQAVHVDQVQSWVLLSAEEVQRYLKSVEDERTNIFKEISRMDSQDRVAAEASRISSPHIGEGGRQFTFTELSNPPAITSQYSPSARPSEQSGIRCNCGSHLAAVSTGSSPVEISCSSCVHITCEAAVKKTMVSKRPIVKHQPVGIEAGCEVNTYEVDNSMDIRLSRNQLSQLTTDDMTPDLMDIPNLLRSSPSTDHTHSEDSHGTHRTAINRINTNISLAEKSSVLTRQLINRNV